MAINVYKPGTSLNNYQMYKAPIFTDFVVDSGGLPAVSAQWLIDAFVAAGWSQPDVPELFRSPNEPGRYVENYSNLSQYTGPEEIICRLVGITRPIPGTTSFTLQTGYFGDWPTYSGVLAYGNTRGSNQIGLPTKEQLNEYMRSFSVAASETLTGLTEYLESSLYDFKMVVNTPSRFEQFEDNDIRDYNNGGSSFSLLIPGETIVSQDEFDRQFLNHLIDNHDQRVICKDGAFYLEGPEL